MAYVEGYFEVDVDVEDFYESCSEREKKDLIELLEMDKLVKSIKHGRDKTDDERVQTFEDSFYNNLEKLKESFQHITLEDLSTLEKIFGKYIKNPS